MSDKKTEKIEKTDMGDDYYVVENSGDRKFLEERDFEIVDKALLDAISFTDDYTFNEVAVFNKVTTTIGLSAAVALAAKYSINGYQASTALNNVSSQVKVKGVVYETVDLLSRLRIKSGVAGESNKLKDDDLTINRICRVFARSTKKYLTNNTTKTPKLVTKVYMKARMGINTKPRDMSKIQNDTKYREYFPEPSEMRVHLFIGGENICSMAATLDAQKVRDAYRLCAQYQDTLDVGKNSKWLVSMNTLFLARGEDKYA